ncbi:MAG: vWA domain-containing protein, partial [Chloroflexota bacterium]
MRHFYRWGLLVVMWVLFVPVAAGQATAPVGAAITTSDPVAVLNETEITVTIELDGSTANCPIIPTNRPVDAALLIDTSGSMGSENFIEPAKNAAIIFVQTMNVAQGDQIGLVDFD